MIELLQQEALTGFRRLAGTRLSGTLVLDDTLLTDALRGLPQAPRGVTLAVHPGNRITLRHGAFVARAVLDDTVTVGPGAPRLGLELASRVVAWTLGRTLRLPALHVDGRRVEFDLGALELLAAYSALWPHLRQVRIRTAEGQLHVEVELAVT